MGVSASRRVGLVIALDLVMPRLDGRLFRARQLQHTDTALIPVVVFTAVEGEELPDVVGIVRKTHPESLLDMIDRAASVPALRN